MKRRAFMITAAGATAGMVLLPRMSFAVPGQIDWYTSSDQNILDFWTNVVKPKFEAANPGVKVEVTSLPWGQAFEKLATMVQGGQIPDVVEMPDRWLSLYANNGQLESLKPWMDQWPETAELTDRTIEFGSVVKDTPFMIPYGFYIRALFWNKKLFKEAGMDKPPATLDEFVEAARALRHELVEDPATLRSARSRVPRRHRRNQFPLRRHAHPPHLALAAQHRSGAFYVRQRLPSREHFRRGNAPVTMVVAEQAGVLPDEGAPGRRPLLHARPPGLPRRVAPARRRAQSPQATPGVCPQDDSGLSKPPNAAEDQRAGRLKHAAGPPHPVSRASSEPLPGFGNRHLGSIFE